MRRKIQDQLALMQEEISHPHVRELEAISACLDKLDAVMDKVQSDLSEGRRVDCGRDGMSGEQTVRVLLLKQMNGFSYQDLSFQLASNICYRHFCRIGDFETAPKRSTLQANIKRLSAATLESIHLELLAIARNLKFEDGTKVRIDCTGIETTIHQPTDSKLLWDTVRTLTRLMHQTSQKVKLTFSNHCRRAKRRYVAILTTKTEEKRKDLYSDLIQTTEKTMRDAIRSKRLLGKHRRRLKTIDRKSERLLEQFEKFILLGKQVVHQTKSRVLEGAPVRVEEKVVSIFEPHTDILIKGRRKIQYGHKVCLSSGPSNLILDCTIHRGNPADKTMTRKMIDRHKKHFGKPPRQAVFDGGFASQENMRELKEAGVQDVAFSKRCGLAITDMVRSSWVYKRLRNFRAGVEGNISFLKRVFGCRRCTWKSFESFKAYVWASIVSCNALTVARHMLASA